MTIEQLPWMAALPYRLFHRSKQYNYAGGDSSKQIHVLGPWIVCVEPFRNCENGDRAVSITLPSRAACVATRASSYVFSTFIGRQLPHARRAVTSMQMACIAHCGLECRGLRGSIATAAATDSGGTRPVVFGGTCRLNGTFGKYFLRRWTVGPLTWSQARIGYCMVSGSAHPAAECSGVVDKAGI